MYVDEKEYRLSKILAVNNANHGYGTGQFQAWTMTYSAIDPSAGLPDKIYTLGPYDS